MPRKSKILRKPRIINYRPFPNERDTEQIATRLSPAEFRKRRETYEEIYDKDYVAQIEAGLQGGRPRK
jgi:hypothetical protein